MSGAETGKQAGEWRFIFDGWWNLSLVVCAGLVCMGVYLAVTGFSCHVYMSVENGTNVGGLQSEALVGC